MPSVRVAWYSDAERDVYHLCQNCHYNDDIKHDHLVIGNEQDIIDDLSEENPGVSEKDLLCDNCEYLLKNWRGIILLIPVD